MLLYLSTLLADFLESRGNNVRVHTYNSQQINQNPSTVCLIVGIYNLLTAHGKDLQCYFLYYLRALSNVLAYNRVS